MKMTHLWMIIDDVPIQDVGKSPKNDVFFHGKLWSIKKTGVSGRSSSKTRLYCPWKSYLQGHLRMIKHNHYMDTHGRYMNPATIAFPNILFSHRCHSNLQDKIVRLLPVRHFICGIVTHQLGGTTCPSDKSVWKQTVAHDADKTTCINV